MRSAGTISRVELAQATGFTAVTISTLVRELISANLLQEVGRKHGGMGTPRRLLAINPGAWLALGIQFDRCLTSIVLLDFAGNVVDQATWPGAGALSPTDAIVALGDLADALLASSGAHRERILGVGLVTHGPQDREKGVLLTPQPTPAWHGYPLVSELQRRLSLPVLLENDATAAAIGEHWVGPRRSCALGLLYASSGLGGGVVVNGEAYRGRSSNAVEFGHIKLNRAGRSCGCGSSGCVETLAGPRAIVAHAVAHPQLRALSLTGLPDDTLTDLLKIAEAAASGAGVAVEMLTEAGTALGEAVVVMANLFDLDSVVLAGPALAHVGQAILPSIQAELDRAYVNRELAPVVARLSQHGATAAAVGGAVVALRRIPPSGH
ncbi:MAG: ROK family transcriptional regulator [Candidatus Nanopelagicales bacterium]